MKTFVIKPQFFYHAQVLMWVKVDAEEWYVFDMDGTFQCCTMDMFGHPSDWEPAAHSFDVFESAR